MRSNSNNEAFQAVQIAEKVYWVGAIDWEVRNFHGYLTSRGTTYNAYLIMAEKPVLLDTVKGHFFKEMMSRIASVTPPENIDYIVSNHSEPDHTGALSHTIQHIRPEKTFASRMGQKALTNHYHFDPETISVVGDGDTLDLGDVTLAFLETRMCHWPDSMVTYLDEQNMLFSQDAFGMHLASYERFADEIDQHILDYEAAKYYANILLHLSSFVKKALNKIKESNLPVSIIAPDHGPIWRTQEDIQHIIDCYAHWAEQLPTRKAVVAYDTMWDSTSKMARAIGEGLAAGGMSVKLLNMNLNHRSDVMTELLDAGAFLVGSATLNNNMQPTMADLMTYVKGLKPRNLVSAAFGSYGWSGEAPKHLHNMLEAMNLDVEADPLKVNYVPDEEACNQCRDLGLKIAEDTLARCEGKTPPAREPVSTTPEKPEEKGGDQCTIDINSGAQTLTVATGQTLFEALRENEIYLPSICGGHGLCGACVVTVEKGGDQVNGTEKNHLNEEQIKAGKRLACQVQLQNDIAIQVSQEVLGTAQYQARLENITELTYDIRLFRFALLEPKEMHYTPGQYLKLNVPETVAPAAPRPFSIANSPSDKGYIELLVRLNPTGICTNYMFRRLQIGDEVTFTGPYGEFGLTDSDAEMIWVAGGSGLSCFRVLLQQMLEENIQRKCTLFFGAVTEADLYMVDELQQMAKDHDWFHFIPALSQPGEDSDWTGETGLITEVLDRHLPERPDIEAYLCGSPGMLKAAFETLQTKKVPPEQIFYDEFTPSV